MKIYRLIGILGILAAITQASTGQTVMDNENAQQTLGSVQVDQTAVRFLIAYSADAAVLEMALPKAGAEAFVPLFASTFRGIPAVNLDVYVANAKDEIWVQSSWPGAQVLAYHRLGAGRALTPFGDMALMDTAFPSSLNGGPVAFPAMDPLAVQKVASFYLYDAP